MDNLLIQSHNVLRWAVVILGLYAVTKAILGLLKKQEYTPNHNLSATLFLSSVDLQLLLGLALYVARGWASKFSDMAGTMSDSVTRFWAIEHAITMIIAAVLVHIGRSKSKKATTAAKKHKISLIFFGIAFLLIMYMIPWSFKPEGIARSLWP